MAQNRIATAIMHLHPLHGDVRIQNPLGNPSKSCPAPLRLWTSMRAHVSSFNQTGEASIASIYVGYGVPAAASGTPSTVLKRSFRKRISFVFVASESARR